MKAAAAALLLLAGCGRKAPIVEGGTIGPDGVFHADFAPFDVELPAGAAVRMKSGGPQGARELASETGDLSVSVAWARLPEATCDDTLEVALDEATRKFHRIGAPRPIATPGAAGARLQRFRSEAGDTAGEARAAVAGRDLFIWSATTSEDDGASRARRARVLDSFRIHGPARDAGVATDGDGTWHPAEAPIAIRFPTPACLSEIRTADGTIGIDDVHRLMSISMKRTGPVTDNERRAAIGFLLDGLGAKLTASKPLDIEGATLGSAWSFTTDLKEGELRYVAVEPWTVTWMALWPKDDGAGRTRARTYLDSFAVKR